MFITIAAMLSYELNRLVGETQQCASNGIMIPTLTPVMVKDRVESLTTTEEKLLGEEHLQKKYEFLAESHRAYIDALTLYSQGSHAEARDMFVKVCRPFLSKPSMKSLYVKVEEFSEELLDSMYYLGQLYLNAEQNTSPDSYSRAAAIFQYCRGFAEKYKIDLTGKPDYQKEAYLCEKKFLEALRQRSDSDYHHGDDEQEDVFLARKSEEYQAHKSKLQQLRTKMAKEVATLKDMSMEHIEERATKVQDLYEETSKTFVAKPGSEAEEKGLIQLLLDDCKAVLGPAPCEYSVVALGSLAGGKMTPWSDLEFAILTANDEYKASSDPRVREYFKNFTKLLHIKIINFGETSLRSVGIESLNNFQTGDAADDWFWDEVIASGFSFDGPHWHACKTPLGRQGKFQVKKKVKDEDTVIEEDVVEIKPDFELIMTPQEMARFQAPAEDEQLDKSWFDTDRHLVQALRNVSLIDGSQELLNSYRQIIRKQDTLHPEVVKSRSLQILAEDIDNFRLKLGDEEEGKLLEVKKSIYRLADRVIEALANYLGISANEDEPGLTAWELIDRMQATEKLDSMGAQHLKEALSIATELRMATYCHNGGQKGSISTYVPAVEHLSEARRKELIEKTFCVEDTAPLHHFYQVMIRVSTLAQLISSRDYNSIGELEFKLDPLINVNPTIEGLIYARFLEYDKAVVILEQQKKHEPQNINLLECLRDMYCLLGFTQQYLVISEEILQLQKVIYSDPDNILLADGLNNLGRAYVANRQYQKAIDCFEEALPLVKKCYEHSSEHCSLTAAYNNLADVYKKDGGYTSAIKYYQESIAIYSKTHQDSSYNVEVAIVYNELGAVYCEIMDYANAKKYCHQALEIMLQAYETNPNHPDIASCYHNLGIAYCKNDPDLAISYYRKSIAIRSVFYKAIPYHPDIVDSYDGIGAAYAEKENYQEAQEHLEKALELALKLYAEQSKHPFIALRYMNLASFYQNLEKYVQAIKYYEIAAEIHSECYKDNLNHPDIGHVHRNLGRIYCREEKYEQALVHCQKALQIYYIVYNSTPNNPFLGNSYLETAVAYYGIGEFVPALEHSVRAFEIFSQNSDLMMACNAKSIADRMHAQLGIIALLESDESNARKYFSKIDEKYESIEFTSLEFLGFIMQNIELASNSSALKACINAQRLLVKLDPDMQYGNHNHNLACYYAVDGDITSAHTAFNLAFKQAQIDLTLHTEYAQFLIVYRNQLQSEHSTTTFVHGTIEDTIRHHLYEVVRAAQSGDSGLSYGQLEKDTVCPLLKETILGSSAEINVSSKVLAYYLLLKYPQFQEEGQDRSELIQSFKELCSSTDNEVELILLSDVDPTVDQTPVVLAALPALESHSHSDLTDKDIKSKLMGNDGES